MYYHITRSFSLFQKGEPYQINDSIYRYRNGMLILFQKNTSPFSIYKAKLLFLIRDCNTIYFPGDLAVRLNPQRRGCSDFNDRSPIRGNAPETVMLSQKSKGNDDRQLPFRHIVHHAQIQKSVLRVGLRAEAEAAAFKPVRHARHK